MRGDEACGTGVTVVERTRLLDRIAQDASGIALVTGGPGMGKSVLLSQVRARADAQGHQVVALDARALGVRRILPGIAATLGPGVPEDLPAIIDALWSRAPSPTIVTVDDAHRLDDDDVDDLGDLVFRAPANVRFVVATRGSVAALAARTVPHRSPTIIDEADLLFDDRELAVVVGDRSTPVEAFRWPARAALSLGAGPGIADDYVWAEVLRGIDLAHREVLAVAAHLRSFDADLLRRCCPGVDDVRAALSPIPLVSETAPGRWTVHAVWEDALAGELDVDRRREIDRHAAQVDVAAGRFEAAAGRLRRAGLWDELLRLAVQLAGDYQNELNSRRFRRWLAGMSAERSELPEAQLVEAVLIMASRPDDALETLHAVQAQFAERGDRTGELAALTQLTRIAVWTQDGGLLALPLARAAELARDGGRDASALAALHRALVATVVGDHEAVLELVDEAMIREVRSFEPVLRWTRGFALLDAGRPTHALLEAQLALELESNPDVELPLRSLQIEATFATEGAAAASALLEEVMPSVVESGIDQFVGAAMVRAVAADAFLGRVDRARDRRLEYRAQIDALDGGQYPVLRGLADVLVLLADGDLGGGEERLRRLAHRHPPSEMTVRGGWLRHAAVLAALAPDLVPVEWAEYPFARRAERLGAAMRSRWAGRGDPTAELDKEDLSAVTSHLPYRWIASLAATAPRATAAFLVDAMGDRAAIVVGQEGSGGPTAELVPATPSVSLEIRLLGPFEVRRGSDVVDDPRLRRRRVRELLALLVFAGGSIGRQRAAARLWPDKSRRASATNLRVNLSHLVGALEPERPPGASSYFVKHVGDDLALDTEHTVVDVFEFDAAIRTARLLDDRRDTGAALEHYLEGLAWWRGPVEVYESTAWAPEEATRLNGVFVEAATRCADLLAAAGRLEESSALAAQAMAAGPFDLEAVRAALYAARRTGSAAEHLVARGRRIAAELELPLPAWVDS